MLYIGKRGNEFREFISKILNKVSNLEEAYVDLLLNESSMELYNQAFTHSSINPECNYEIFEQLGDVTANKILVWYFYRRFPQLNTASGVKVVARLKINYCGKNTFASFAEKLGFLPFISASEVVREKEKISLLEDVFEAFFGVTEYIIDKEILQGCGYHVVYDILSKILDTKSISLKYEDLFDSKTRLKEVFDSKELKMKYNMISMASESENIGKGYTTRIYVVVSSPDSVIGPVDKKNGQFRVHVGSGVGPSKITSEMKASENALRTLKSQNIFRDPPIEYQTLMN